MSTYTISATIQLTGVRAESREDAVSYVNQKLTLLDTKGGSSGDDGYIDDLTIHIVREEEE